MKKKERYSVGVFIAVAILLLTVYNLFGSLLTPGSIEPVNSWLISPFILLLASIALMPFIQKVWWEKNYPFVVFALGGLVVLYYILVLHNIPRLFLTSYEYISFISFIGSLYVVAGGIHVNIPGKATPIGNVSLLATGAVLANIFGTTGASMLLIRPFLRMNRYRVKAYHVVFFIFLVSNIGGALTPIGDPPLFLGYLKGVPFFWITARVAPIWLLTVGLVLAVFYAVDSFHFRKEPKAVQNKAAEMDEPQVSGLHNIVFLFIILGAVFIESPAPILTREIIMLAAALGSYMTTKKEFHKMNDFNFLPIKEVAILFAGIFATMIPALDWLELHARSLGIVTPGQYYWGVGLLSGVLDNAPAYLNFLTAAFGLHGANVDNLQHMNLMLGSTALTGSNLGNSLQSGALPITPDSWKYILAISIGSVFFGATTYIGNGPNFMVKSIAEQSKVHCPSFFGYIGKYSLPILIPVFGLVWLIFFH